MFWIFSCASWSEGHENKLEPEEETLDYILKRKIEKYIKIK